MRSRKLLQEIMRKVDQLERHIDLLHMALIVRDPGTPIAADAYEGLRKQVAAAARERQAHLVQLALMDETLRSTNEPEAARSMLSEFMQQAGIVTVEDPQERDMYQVVGGSGSLLEIISPAYVEEGSGRLIRQGKARAVSPHIENDE
jgi:hypothetical protein